MVTGRAVLQKMLLPATSGTSAARICARVSVPWTVATMSESGQSDQTRAGYGLDAVNFFLADVRDGIGRYLAFYLLTELALRTRTSEPA